MKSAKTFHSNSTSMVFPVLYILVFESIVVTCTRTYDFVLMDQAVQEGRKQYEMLLNQAPRYGDCWTEAVRNLHDGCKSLSDDSQSRMAVSFANCFLEKAGLDTYVCFEEMTISECVKNMDERAFSVYTEFFTHTQSICFFLLNQVWQQQTEDTINKLTDTSSRVSHHLDATKQTQEQILNLQQESLDKQQKLLRSGESLTVALERSKTSAENMYEEFKSTTNKHTLLIFEVFDRITKLQELFLTEFSLFYTLIFYTIAVIISYLLTATARTNGARLWLFAVMILCGVCERIVAMFSLNEEVKKEVLYAMTGPLYQRIWICRKVACLVGILILLWCSYRYKNYKVLNNKLLLEIHKQICELKSTQAAVGLTPQKPNNFLKKHNPNPELPSSAKLIEKRNLNHNKKSFHCVDYYSSDDNLSGDENLHFLMQENIRDTVHKLPMKISQKRLLVPDIVTSNMLSRTVDSRKRQSNSREIKASQGLQKEKYNLRKRHHSRASEQ